MASATERIAVRVTAQQKRAITAKAKKLGLAVSELMRRGVTSYETAQADEKLGALADAAKAASYRASCSVDETLAFIGASNKRIAAKEAKAAASNRKGN